MKRPAQIDSSGYRRERGLANQSGTQLCELAFRGDRIFLKEHLTHGESEHAVPKELETLVMPGPDAAMPKRCLQQRCVCLLYTSDAADD